MNAQDLKIILEAVLLAAGRPLTNAQLLELFDERERPSEELLAEAFALLAADYESRGIEVREVATGWRIQIRTRCVDVVSRLWQERATRYSRALLETLALIAYRQPITRSEIEEIRGVAISSSIMRTIQERDWIRIVGHREVPGRPELLGTTKEFLDYFGLQSLDQLPTLAELRDVENIGVQLELPSGEAPAANDSNATSGDASTEVAASDTDSTATGNESSEIEAQATDSSDDDSSADAGEDSSSSDSDSNNDSNDDESDSGNTPTMVAESDESVRTLQAPPSESE
jgi:segregation and condensation protein B